MITSTTSRNVKLSIPNRLMEEIGELYELQTTHKNFYPFICYLISEGVAVQKRAHNKVDIDDEIAKLMSGIAV